MTVVDVLRRVDELADGTGGSVDAATGRKSVHIGNPGLEGPATVCPGGTPAVMGSLEYFVRVCVLVDDGPTDNTESG